MAYRFPDREEIVRQIEKGYLKPNRDFDLNEFMDFIYFELWRAGKLSQEKRRPLFEHSSTLLRGGWRYVKKKISAFILGSVFLLLVDIYQPLGEIYLLEIVPIL